jgi:hypothetical protein
MDRRPIELKRCVNHIEPWHEMHMGYDGMSKGVVNQDGKHRWYLMMQSMSKPKKEEKTTMLKTSTSCKLMTTCVRCMVWWCVKPTLVMYKQL